MVEKITPDYIRNLMNTGQIFQADRCAVAAAYLEAMEDAKAISEQAIGSLETISELTAENARLVLSLKAAKELLEASETPFYEGMKLLNEALGGGKDD